MKRFACVYVWLLCLVLSIAAQEKVVKLKIVQTSDVHGDVYKRQAIYSAVCCIPG